MIIEHDYWIQQRDLLANDWGYYGMGYALPLGGQIIRRPGNQEYVLDIVVAMRVRGDYMEVQGFKEDLDGRRILNTGGS